MSKTDFLQQMKRKPPVAAKFAYIWQLSDPDQNYL